MGIVRGRDTNVGVQIALEGSTWGAAASGTGLYSWHNVPILSESLNLDAEAAPESDEISSLGARESYDIGRRIPVGTITVRPRIDSDWFNILMAQMGYEDRDGAKWVDGTPETTSSAIATHTYSIATAMPNGFNTRVYISGSDTTGSIKLFKGCLVRSWTIQHDANDHIRVTFDIVAKTMELINASGPGALGSPEGSIKADRLDLGRFDDPANPMTTQFDSVCRFRIHGGDKNDYTELKLNRYTCTIDKSVDFDDALLSYPDTPDKPGTQAQRAVTIEFEGPYEATAFTGDHPYHYFISGNKELGFEATYTTATAIAGTTTGVEYYAYRLVIPKMELREGTLNVDKGGTLVWRAVGVGVLGGTTLYPQSLTPADDLAQPGSPGCDVYFRTCVADIDPQLGAGQKFSDSPNSP